MVDIKLEVGGVYKTHVKDLVKIEKIPGPGMEKYGEFYIYNITESCHQWLFIKNHRLVLKIR